MFFQAFPSATRFPQDLLRLVLAGLRRSAPSWLPGLMLCGVCSVLPGRAAETKARLIQEDFPFQTACVGAPFPPVNDANKGLALRVGRRAAMCFDTDLLRMSAGWTGGFISERGVTFDGGHGGHPQIVGTQVFGTKPGPGWADAKGSFNDPRTPEPYGPIPESSGRWNGLYTVGPEVVLSYTVLGMPIVEWPSSVAKEGEIALVRTLQVPRAKVPLALLICDGPGATGRVEGRRARFGSDTNLTLVAVVGQPVQARLEIVDGSRLVLKLPLNSPGGTFKVVIWSGPASKESQFETLAAGEPEMIHYSKGGKAHWPETVITHGALGTSDGPYVLDRLTPPSDNPWNRRVRFGGLDFFSDGKRAALSTWDGDVWIVSGIDDSLQKLVWRRFASGGFETLGLKIVDDVIYTSGRDQITRYEDLNDDGEADYYENFNNQVTSSAGFHEFQFDLHTDREGNFYTAKAGPVRAGGSGFGGGGGNGEVTAFAGTIQKISKDGKKREVYATGFRAPNGIGVGPDGQVTSGDNEGTWVPVCPIHWIRKGGFYGVEDLAHRVPVPEFNPPLCWIAKSYDNSGGGQVWVTSDKWGPFKGELLHMSYGRCALYLVLKEKVGAQMQGGIVRIAGGADAAQFTGYETEVKVKEGGMEKNKAPVKFTSSAMRARFNPRDGQLYVAGLNGWQSDAAKLTGFDRIRYTGKPVYTVSRLKVARGELQLTFTRPLDPASVDPQNFSAERWNYHRTKAYGSAEYSVDQPEKKGHDPVEISAARLSSDGRTLTLRMADLKPAHQMLLKYQNLKARDGTPIQQTILHTIHAIP